MNCDRGTGKNYGRERPLGWASFLEQIGINQPRKDVPQIQARTEEGRCMTGGRFKSKEARKS